jgi:glycosyltransferase involved in cell wall biosynthesis
MNFFNRLRHSKLVVITFDFNPHGGSFISINNYSQYSKGKGEIVEMIAFDSRYGFVKILISFFLAKKILFNSLYCFNFSSLLLFSLLRKDALVYLHETQYAINDFKKRMPFKYKVFKKVVQKNRIVCVSRKQQEYFISEFGAKSTFVVYENIGSRLHIPFPKGQGLHILMVGYIMERKGVDLFSRVADKAKQEGENWNFHWIGSGSFEGLYKSDNVRWLGYHPYPRIFYEDIDIFFLSSVDDPFPLSCLEALGSYKKVVCYKGTGVEEILSDVSGCAVFEDYSVEAAFNALKSALNRPLDIDKVNFINRNISSTASFSERFDGLLSQ